MTTETSLAHGLEHTLRTATDAEIDEFLDHYRSLHIAYQTITARPGPAVKYRAFIVESIVVDEHPDGGPQGTRVIRTPLLLEDNYTTTRVTL